ncbi:MAG: site-2 protease family protein, partial [Candidatus Gracilibacteria bacterium]|nr:site-2 protease family protein [Candidatus Gracilibacteria bacterium]
GVLLFPTEGSIADLSGIKKGDLLIGISTCDENCDTKNNLDITDSQNLLMFINGLKNKKILLKIKSGEEIKNIELILDKNGKIGAYLGDNLGKNEDFEYDFGIIESTKYAFLETVNQIRFTFSGIKMLFNKIFFPKDKTERQEAINQVSGPIGVVDFMSKTISQGIIFILIIGALISINLGVFNLLPIPALDGGRFVFIVINGIIKKIFGRNLITNNFESIIHVTFFIILIALSLIIAYNDVIKIINN